MSAADQISETDPAQVEAATGVRVDADSLEAELIARDLRARLFGEVEEAPRIGRYVLVERLGAGGMGVVFSAYDATLDRKVAIKFIHAHLAGQPSTRERFLREARAMARLSHPNVVQIHEADEADGRLFLALEFVVGSTLRTYLADHRDALQWREIVAIFRDAGEGLAAAHAAGIVHRDFKPDNVLRTEGGAIKVADFGLAGLAMDEAHGSASSPGELGVTAPDGVVGTLAYMAPEQHRRQPCDARADQFAFCVALFEALFGAPPFAGNDAVSRMVAVIEGRRTTVARAGVPARVREIVERGLAIDPNHRWPSMRALLEQLDRARAPRRIAVWAFAALAIVGATAMLARPEAAVDACATAGVEADDLVAAHDDAVERWATAWARVEREGCIAHKDGVISAELYDRRQACLAGELAAARTQLALGTALDPAATSRCTDAVRLTAGPIPGDAGPGRDTWIALREQVARADAALARGDHEAAEAIAVALRETNGDSRLRDDVAAHGQWLHGRALRVRGDHEAALAAITDAIARADAIGDDDLRARALVDGVWIAGVDLLRADEAHRMAALADGALTRAGLAATLSTSLHEARGLTAMYEGNNDVARSELQLALEGTTLPDARATLHANLASVRLREGDAAGAVTELEQALVQIERGDSSQQAGVLNNLGYALLAAGRPERALEIHTRSLALREQLSGADSIEAANAIGGMGLALLELGRKADARRSLERALAIRLAHEGRAEDLAEVRFGLARALGPDDPRAIELATAALDAYRPLDAFAREAATVAAWLEHATPRR
jgi:tetratricopeptide (TPR) repeat protein